MIPTKSPCRGTGLRWIILRCLFAAAFVVAGEKSVASAWHSQQSAAKESGTEAPAHAALRERVEKAESAKAASSPAEVAHASELVIAVALRQLGHLRLVESAYAQAQELFGRSLDFENLPNTRIDLAIADQAAGLADKAIAEADRALLDDPNNERAFQVLGQAWTWKINYSQAARAFVRAAELAPTLENQYTAATALLQTKRVEDKQQAEHIFEQMTETAGDSGSLHVLFGRAYRDAREMPDAIREFETAIKIDPRTPHAHYFLGLAYLSGNEWVPTPQVRSEFLTELQANPRDYLANYMMGFAASAERRYGESNKYLKLATELKPESPDPWSYLGLNAYAQQDTRSAEAYFRKAIELTGTDYARSNYLIRRAYIDLGRILTTSGRKEEAQQYLDKGRELQNEVLRDSQKGMANHFLRERGDATLPGIIASQPNEEDLILRPSVTEAHDPFAELEPSVLARSNLTHSEKQQAEAQEKELRAVLAQAFSDLATSEAIRKDYAAALRHYQEAEHWDASQAGIQRNLGVAAFRTQNYPETVRTLSAHLAAHPEDAPSRAMLGMAYAAQEKYKDAAKTFEPLGAKGVQDAAAGYAWAMALTRLGELPRATEVLKEFQQQERPNEMLLLVGQLWIEIGDYSRAVETFHRILERDPSYPKVHFFAGQAYIRWEHWPEAAQEFRSELNLTPNDADAKYNLGFVLLQQSRVDDAAKLFEEAIAAKPDHSGAHYEYGKILLDRGNVQDAVSHLETAVRLAPQADYVHYQLQSAYRKEGRIIEANRELEIYKKLKANQRGRASMAISSQTP